MSPAAGEVRIGLQVPQAGPNAIRPFIARFVRHAVALGISSFWVGDHIVLGGYEHRAKETETFLEPLVLLSYIAGLEPDVDLGTSILVVPYRNAFSLAKELCSLAHLTGRRIIAGVGAGWAELEFNTVGADFHRRGRDTDRFCEIFNRLKSSPDQPWTVGPYRYPGGGFHPLPTPQTELWVGGNSAAAQRRAARYATGWQPTGLPPEEAQAGMAEVRRLREAAGGDPATLTSGIRLRLRVRPETYQTELPALLARYVEAGVMDFLVELNSRDQEYTLEAVERLAESWERAHAG